MSEPWRETVWEVWSQSIAEAAASPPEGDGEVMLFAGKIRAAALEEACKAECVRCQRGDPVIELAVYKSVEWKFGHGDLWQSDDYISRCNAWRIRAKMEGE